MQILGPVRAWRGSVEIALGGPKQRAVLALLLANVGEPVSYRTVIEVVWPGAPPASAVNVVQTYLKRLRRVLEPHRAPGTPSRLLRRVPHGYLADATEQELDLLRFRRLVEQSRQARHIGELDRARELLGAAVHPWHGPPLADLDLLVRMHPNLAALEQEWLGAALDYADLELMAGRPAGLVPWLEQIVGSAPLHEPLQGRLIAAYGWSGRRADAIKAYHRARTILHDELGVDPCPELQDVYDWVMRADQTPPPMPR